MGSVAVPPRTVAETNKINTNKSTDVLAIVKELSATRTCKSGETVADAIFIDGSKKETEKVAISVACFGPAKVAFIREQMGKPLVFLNLTIKCSEGKRDILHWPSDEVLLAPDCCKATELREKGADLQSAPVVLLTTQWQPTHQRLDVSGPQTLSCCGMLDFAAEAPEAEHMPEVVQVNWARIEEPGLGSEIVDKSRARIWFLTKMSDITGSVQVGIPERTALTLSNCQTKEEFEAVHSRGDLQFPLFHNVRLNRKGKAFSASQPGEVQGATEAPVYVSHVVEEVSAVTYTGDDAPNAAYCDILTILSQCPRHDESWLFAALAEVQKCPHYGFDVVFQKTGSGTASSEPFRGSAVVALLGSTVKSSVQA